MDASTRRRVSAAVALVSLLSLALGARAQPSPAHHASRIQVAKVEGQERYGIRFIRPRSAFLAMRSWLTGPPAPRSRRSSAQSQAHPRLHAGGSLTVFAAASLKEAFSTIGAQFGKAHNASVTFNFGGSDMLVTQIAQGAPADVFASANTAQMTIAQQNGLTASKPAVFVRNKLLVILPKNNPGHIHSLRDLGRRGVRLVLAAPGVPVGKYARAAFAAMAHDPSFGHSFLTHVSANIVSNELDVKAVAAKVILGEADAGVVYVTDVTAKVAPQVRTLTIPTRYNQIATYPIAVVKGSHDPTLARAFIAYVLSAAGQRVLTHSGFITVSMHGATPYAHSRTFEAARRR